MIAFYWSITTLTTIGYGDIVPQSQEEYVLVLIGMLFGATTWAYVIGSITLIVSTLDVEAVRQGQLLDQLNFFMRERSVPQNLRVELRRFFAASRGIARWNINRNLVARISPALREQVVEATYQWLRDVTVFRSVSTPFLVEMLQYVG